MADIPFKPTDVVRVRSGGPKMTVSQVGERYGDPTVWCVWFDKGKKFEDTFHPDALEIAQDDPTPPYSRRR
jgi:uncharacterized protein YodC (DUF2158 family)